MNLRRLAVLVCILALAACAAGANDLYMGSQARMVALGGAGLALTDGSAASVINPAAGIASGAKFRFLFPSLELTSQGASVNDLQTRLNQLGSNSASDAEDLAVDFGTQNTSLNAGLSAGVSGPLGITFEGEAQGLIHPGSEFKEWVLAGHPTALADITTAVLQGKITNANLDGNVPANSDLGAYADDLTADTRVAGKLLYALPAVTYGMGFDALKGKLFVGTKMKLLHSDVRTWQIQASAVGDDVVLDAVDNGSQEDNGFAADLGFVYQPSHSLIQYGAVIDNLISPNLKGVPVQSMLSVGIASRPNPRFLFAVDLVNLNKAYNEKTSLRLGAEMMLTKRIAVRAGMCSGDFTYGFGYGGMDIAFTSEAPAMISRTLRF